MTRAPESIRFAAIAVDAIVCGLHEGELCVLVDTVQRPPHYVDVEAFIGGLIEARETAEAALERHLEGKVGLTNMYIEQLQTFSAVNRDKRNRVVATAYLCLVRPDTIASFAHASARWVPVRKLPHLAYDHNDMYTAAHNRLRGKLQYTTIAQFLLPKHFTLTQLQEVYEIIEGKEYDKRNFRKKMLSFGILKDTGRMQEGVKNRPAALYTFKKQSLTELPLLV